MSEFVEVKTQDLSGAVLDWAVAKVEGFNYDPNYLSHCAFHDGKTWTCKSISNYRPSADWSHGGPLIEKYKLDIGAPMENQNGTWNAATEWAHPMGYKGETPLIAACRAIVASSLGDTVSVPKELV